MTIYYVSNENGDWWTINTEDTTGQTLFIIKEEELKKVTGEDDIDALDKLEESIREYGKALDIEVEQ